MEILLISYYETVIYFLEFITNNLFFYYISVNLIRNLIPSIQSPPASPLPSVPLMIPVLNYPISSPLLPITAFIQVTVPGSSGLPVVVTPIFRVPSSSL